MFAKDVNEATKIQFQNPIQERHINYLADTLSRAALPDPVGAQVTGFEVFRIDPTRREEHNERLSKETEGKLRDTISSDPTLAQLRTTILKGWPKERRQVSKDLQQYGNYRDELTVQNDIIYKGHHVLIPQSMQADASENSR